ncbi:MAG: hypothetical protein JNL90_05430 [Planctomycetes bacterium]|nr:hypothetical protein [Planctomycetota bacterium]
MRVLFMGRSHGFSLAPLAALAERHAVVAIVESGGRGARPDQGSALAEFARGRGLPYLLLDKGTRGALEPFVRAAAPDLLAIASLTQLLPAAVIALARHGAINLHPSLLPRWPGPYPWLWQYLAFEREIGVTVHALDEGEDSGPILAQERVAVEPGLPLAELTARVEPIGARLMAAVADALAAGRAEPRAQGPRPTPRARAVRRDEPLIDFDGWSLERCWHALRGTQHWLDGARWPLGRYAGAKWTIGAAQPGPASTTAERPAGSVGRDASGYFVAHRDGKIRVAPRLRWSRQLRNLARGLLCGGARRSAGTGGEDSTERGER